MVRTGFPGQLEHFGSAAIATAGYGLNRSATRVIGCFWLYAGILEYLQDFSPGRHPAFLDFAASAMGSLCGGVAVALLAPSLYAAGWECRRVVHHKGEMS